MRDFQLRLLNYPAERLFKPQQRLAAVHAPSSIVKLLPFSVSDLSEIDEDSDFIEFIEYFAFGLNFDHVEDFNEYVCSSDFYLFFKDIFTENTRELILVLKYLYSVKRVLQGLVSDDSIFSYHLPYLAEASFDLECSLVLIKAGYFKQSLQTLRNVIEVTLTHGYFAIKDYDYFDLIETTDYRVPAIKEMIIFLRSENLFIGDLEREIFELYKILSGAVHSEIIKLNTGCTPLNPATFKEWYHIFIRVSIIHLRLIMRMQEIGI